MTKQMSASEMSERHIARLARAQAERDRPMDECMAKATNRRGDITGTFTWDPNHQTIKVWFTKTRTGELSRDTPHWIHWQHGTGTWLSEEAWHVCSPASAPTEPVPSASFSR